MQKLDDLKTEIEILKAYVFCQENGNDLYYSSPLYQKNLFRLQALEAEYDVLTGKLTPWPVSFEKEDLARKNILTYLAKTKGSWYAARCRDLSLRDLKSLEYEECRQNDVSNLFLADSSDQTGSKFEAG
jgi:hypothetical protein